MSQTALITGATSGIGRATAFEFAKHNINLIICGRREDRLETIKSALEKSVSMKIGFSKYPSIIFAL